MAAEAIITRFCTQVVAPLNQLGRTLKRYVLLEGLLRCLLIFVACAMVQLFLDRLLVLGVGPRAAMLLVVLSLVGYQLFCVLRTAMVSIGAGDIAAVLERQNVTMRDQLVSAVAFASGAGQDPHRDSPVLVRALIQQSASQFKALPLKAALRRDRHVRNWGMVVGVLLLVLLAFVAAPDTLATYIQRDLLLGDLAWPMSTRIVVQGFRNGEMTWPIGDELTLVARAEENVPSTLRAEFATPSDDRAVREMDRRGTNQFVLDYGPLTQAMKVRFLIRRFGADQHTGWYTIKAVYRPSVKTVRIDVTPPAYTGIKPFGVPLGQASADIIRGSKVRIDATLSKKVVQAELRRSSDGQHAAEATIDGETHVWASFVPSQKDTFYFDVLDDDGLEDTHPVTYSFRLIDDSPPKVRLTLPGAGELVVPNAILNLAVDCEDNLGLRSVQLIHEAARASEGSPATQPTKALEALPEFVPGQLRYTLQSVWPLLPLTLKSGDQLTLQVEASDYQPTPSRSLPAASTKKEPSRTLGRSLAYTLRVVTTDELLTELGRREHEWRREFEQIIKSQEQINRRVRDLRDRHRTESRSYQLSIRYGQEARTQRQQIGRLKTVARQFEKIFSELKVNQLANPGVRHRLSGGVLIPMKRLIHQQVADAADRIEKLRLQFDEKQAASLEGVQDKIVRRMYDILSNMMKWEGYNEAVGLLRDIVRLQQEIKKDTKVQLEGEIERLFGDEPKEESNSKSKDQP